MVTSRHRSSSSWARSRSRQCSSRVWRNFGSNPSRSFSRSSGVITFFLDDRRLSPGYVRIQFRETMNQRCGFQILIGLERQLLNFFIRPARINEPTRLLAGQLGTIRVIQKTVPGARHRLVGRSMDQDEVGLVTALLCPLEGG